MKKVILFMLLLPAISEAQTLKGLVTYTDVFHSQEIPEFNSSIEIFKYNPHTGRAYDIYSKALSTEIENQRYSDRYEYGKVAFGKRNDFTKSMKKEIEQRNITDKTMDSLRDLSSKLWIELHSYEAIKNDFVTKIKSSVNGEYSIKLPPGKYYAYSVTTYNFTLE